MTSLMDPTMSFLISENFDTLSSTLRLSPKDCSNVINGGFGPRFYFGVRALG